MIEMRKVRDRVNIRALKSAAMILALALVSAIRKCRGLSFFELTGMQQCFLFR